VLNNKGTQIIRFNFSDDKLPVFVEEKSKDLVRFGSDNNYPAKLIDYFNNSTFHGAIVARKADFIAGAGIEYNEDLPPAEKAIVERYIKRPNNFMNLATLIHRDALHLCLFGAIPHQVAWQTSGKGFDVYFVPYEKLRTNKDLSKIYFKDDWTKDLSKTGTAYDAFNPELRTGIQINYFRMFRPGMDTYPLPDYINTIKSIAVDTKISTFHNSNLDNGFAAGTMIEIVTGPITDTDTKDKIENKLKKKVGGAENGGSILLNFIESDNQKSNVVQLTGNDLDKRFQQLYDQARDAIFSGHGVTSPTLFGIATPGALGQRAEMLDAYELFYATYVEMRQRVIEEVHNGYLKAMGVSDPGLKIKKSQPIGLDVVTMIEKGFITKEAAAQRMGVSLDEMPQEVQATETQRTIEAINTLSPLVANNVLAKMTDNEIRALAGLPAIDGGDKINGASVPQPVTFSAIPDDYEPPADADKWKDEDCELFAQFGEVADDYEVLVELQHDWLDEKHSFTFADIGDIEAKILDLIAKNEKIDVTQLADVAKLNIDDVISIVGKLADKGLLKTANSGGGALIITPDGTLAVKDYGKEFRQVYVKWKYNGPQDDRNRPFCSEMLKMNRIYSRAEIDKLSTMLGYDVWKRRGGWYHVPGTEVNLPYCRHTWTQQVVRKKIG
jgi:predicted transcriptional regulator